MKIGRQFISFALVGVAGLVVDLGVLYLLQPTFGWYVARVLSFMAAVTTTWALNRQFTFADRHSGQSIVREYARYLLTMLAGAAVNYAVYVLTLHWLGDSLGRLAPGLGVAFGSVAGMALNFLSARFLVFKVAKP